MYNRTALRRNKEEERNLTYVQHTDTHTRKETFTETILTVNFYESASKISLPLAHHKQTHSDTHTDTHTDTYDYPQVLYNSQDQKKQRECVREFFFLNTLKEM